MKYLRGFASRSVVTLDIRRSSDEHGESVKYVQTATFCLGEHKVRIELPARIVIRDGDAVAVYGKWKRDTFHAFAYRNSTTRTEGDIGSWAQWKFLFVLFMLPLVACLLTHSPVAVAWAVPATITLIRLAQLALARHKLHAPAVVEAPSAAPGT